MRQVSLQQLVIRYAAVVLTVIVIMALCTFLLLRQSVVEDRQANLLQTISIKAGSLSQLVLMHREVVKKLAHQQTVMDLMTFGSADEAHVWAISMQNLLPDNIGLALFDEDANVLGNPVELRIGQSCIDDLQSHIKSRVASFSPVHSRVEGLAHFDIVENIVADGRVVGLVFASFSLDLLRRELERIAETGQVLEIYAADGQLVAASGKTDALNVLLESNLPINGTNWTLKLYLHEPPMNHIAINLGVVNGLLFMAVCAVLYVFARQLIRVFTRDIDAIQKMLVHVKEHQMPQQNAITPQLRETEHIAKGIQHLARDISYYQQRLMDLSATDELTGLLNRRAFNQELQRCLNLGRRGMEIHVAMLDLDYLKQINDRYGHDAGDEIIRSLANCFKQNLRSSDVVARLGGDEFAVILMQCTAEQARQWFQNLLKAFESVQHTLKSASDLPGMCSISAGCVRVDASDTDVSALLKRADELLYQAKHAGRGRMVCG